MLPEGNPELDIMVLVRRGGRRLRRRRAVRRTAGWLLAVVLVVFLVRVGVEQPWATEPAQVTPPLEGW
ncbi:hypothetical protein [Streptomyces anulatus]|uniref:hypothetical protein n=1 Tax=Streptomyces anulatus TaxID=1892 RepID=UPI003D9DE7A8